MALLIIITKFFHGFSHGCMCLYIPLLSATNQILLCLWVFTQTWGLDSDYCFPSSDSLNYCQCHYTGTNPLIHGGLGPPTTHLLGSVVRNWWITLNFKKYRVYSFRPFSVQIYSSWLFSVKKIICMILL